MAVLAIDGLKVADLPGSWRELTCGQLKQLSLLLASGLDADTLRLVLLLRWGGLDVVNEPSEEINGTCHWLRGKRIGRRLVALEDLNYVLEQFDFLFGDDVGEVRVIESRLIKNHFGWFRGRFGIKLHGPDGGLFNITWMEFIRMEMAYARMKTHEDAIYELIGIMYRRRDWTKWRWRDNFDGDYRVKYNDHHLKSYERRARGLPSWAVVYCRLFYEGCRAFIISEHPGAFGGGGGGGGKKGESKPNQFKEFMKLTNALAGNDPTKGGLVRQTYLWDILPEMERMAEVGKKLEGKK